MKAALFLTSTTLAAVSCGVALGYLGGHVETGFWTIVAVLLAVSAVLVAVLELIGRSVPLPQLNRETSQAGLRAHPRLWVVRNGLALGIGASSRIGFWLWYVIPTASFLAGSELWGGVIFGAYGLIRGGAPWILVEFVSSGRSNGDLVFTLLRKYPLARRLTSGYQLFFGCAMVVALGF